MLVVLRQNGDAGPYHHLRLLDFHRRLRALQRFVEPLLSESILKGADDLFVTFNSNIKYTCGLRRAVPPDHRGLLCCSLSLYMEPEQCSAALQESYGRCIWLHRNQSGRYVYRSNLNPSMTIWTVS